MWCISVRLEDCKYFLRIYVGCVLKHTLNIKCVASVGVEQGCQTQFTWRYIQGHIIDLNKHFLTKFPVALSFGNKVVIVG